MNQVQGSNTSCTRSQEQSSVQSDRKCSVDRQAKQMQI
ncbi:hypothetical protein L293_0490 [Acinetobacter gyllenbergii CIP 110306 = MTCC 11365]|nr:hypothetical protein L293_0490 [Acinetobacter gyllenbergii CIP 110306 = MTCC 11365]